MTRRKSVCSKWTLVLLVVIFSPFVYTRPQETSSVPPLTSSSTANSVTDKATENPIRTSSQKAPEEPKKPESSTLSPVPDSSRNVKNKTPIIGDSIKMVATQLLENPSNTTVETPIVIDTRIPPKLKNQLAHKHKIKRHEDGQEPIENGHAGIAVPVTMEELEIENKISEVPIESSTSNEGISTWILLSNPPNKDNVTTEPTKTEEPQKKQKPNGTKNKNKRPATNKVPVGKRPLIGSTNKSDLIASGSAINENVYNKIKDTVLSNVQKNKNSSRTSIVTTTTTSTQAPSTEALTTKKDTTTKSPASEVPVSVKVTSKPTKKKNRVKTKVTTSTTAPVVNESALLPMEPKEQEIELEISTPATTTKKPKRSSTRKKNKTKKRKTSKPKPETGTAVSETKNSNKTKTKTKTSKKPSLTSLTAPISSQIYSYLSREVMPSVGVGMLGLASLVGIAGYFLYPFTTPVRRTFEVDKKDDIYRHNAEEYASEGNGQAEEEMLGTVLAGMPVHSKQKINPYAGQTAHVNRYPVKKEQDIRYRHVATKYEPNYNGHYPQQKTGIAHAAVYAEPVNYNTQYQTRHVYTTEGKYVYDKGPAAYTPRPVVEPIYAAPQTGPTGVSAYGSDTSNSVVYGVKPSSESDFKPVYPFEGQFYSEVTTSSPMTYQPTSMYLGSNEEAEKQEENEYTDTQNSNGESDNKFVVGNVPKELADSATPAVVPEHGPRNLKRRKRNTIRRKRSISGSLEQILKEEKEKNKDIFISNEIDEALGFPPIQNLAAVDEMMPMKNDIALMPEVKEIPPVTSVSVDPKEENISTDVPFTSAKDEVVESVSTVPIENTRGEKITTESDTFNELETTTKTFKVYEVFPSNNPTETGQSSPAILKTESTTLFRNMNTETTTELKSETTSTMPPSPSPILDASLSTTPSIISPKPTNNPEVLTYPPLNQNGGFLTFIKRLIDFKYRLGLSVLQTTADNLNRYLRSMENTAQKVAKASKT